MIVTNLTVWADIPALQAFVYKSVHRYFLQNRRHWFSRVDTSQFVMWWVRAGDIPTLSEAKEKLQQLDNYGPSPHAFSLQQAFDASGAPMQLPRLFRHEA